MSSYIVNGTCISGTCTVLEQITIMLPVIRALFIICCLYFIIILAIWIKKKVRKNEECE